MNTKNLPCKDEIEVLKKKCKFDEVQMSNFGFFKLYGEDNLRGQNAKKSLEISGADVGRMEECHKKCPYIRDKVTFVMNIARVQNSVKRSPSL